jgi:hypothetical protein
MELTGKGNFRLLAAKGKRKRQTTICLLPTEMENESLFFLVGKHKR